MNGNEQRRNTRKMTNQIVTVILVVVLLFSTVMFLLSLWERYHGQYTGKAPQTEDLFPGYTLRDNIETMLVIGLDTYTSEESDSYNNNQQADFLLLLVMDNANGTCKAIHINRDTITDMNVLGVGDDSVVGVVQRQIALAHTYGDGGDQSCRNTVDAVSNLLMGVKIDYYVSVTMDAVPTYNDLAGGVTLEVLDDFSTLYPEMTVGSTVTLTGEQALAYVRARKGLEDPSNSRRMTRQKQYLEALYERSRLCMQEQSDFAMRAVQATEGYLVTNCSGNRLESQMSRFTELDEILSIDGELIEGEQFMEFYPDVESIKQVVLDCFYEPAE